MLWTHPRDTARQQQRTVQAELLVGPLLLVATGLVDAYFCSRLLRRRLRGHWYRRASGGRGGELALEDIRGAGARIVDSHALAMAEHLRKCDAATAALLNKPAPFGQILQVISKKTAELEQGGV